jgi:hypothetical protein
MSKKLYKKNKSDPGIEVEIDDKLPKETQKHLERITRETFGKRALSSEVVKEACETYNVSLVDNVFVMGPPKNDKERLLNQVHYWIANNNLFKARLILKSLNFTSKMIKAYINDEQDLQKEAPELSGFNSFYNKPMPDTIRVKGV